MFLCFPGWACQLSLDHWQGRDARVVGHREQWSALEKNEVQESWIPREPWDLLTWSMGTWTGLALSARWKHNPPRSWLALSPFLHLCPDHGAKVKRPELETLLSSFRKSPLATLGLFERRQGGKAPWAEGLGDRDFDMLGRSLEALLSPCPWELSKEARQVPVNVLLGERDRLVAPQQSRTFAKLFSKVNFEIIKDKGHALLYEEAHPEGTLLSRTEV